LVKPLRPIVERVLKDLEFTDEIISASEERLLRASSVSSVLPSNVRAEGNEERKQVKAVINICEIKNPNLPFQMQWNAIWGV